MEVYRANHRIFGVVLLVFGVGGVVGSVVYFASGYFSVKALIAPFFAIGFIGSGLSMIFKKSMIIKVSEDQVCIGEVSCEWNAVKTVYVDKILKMVGTDSVPIPHLFIIANDSKIDFPAVELSFKGAKRVKTIAMEKGKFSQ